MYDFLVIDIFKDALFVSIVMLSFLIVPGLIVGLMVALFQALTQINEMSLSFMPKLFITLIVLIVLGPWMSNYMVSFTVKLYQNIPYMIS